MKVQAKVTKNELIVISRELLHSQTSYLVPRYNTISDIKWHKPICPWLTQGQGHNWRSKVTDVEVSAFSECFLFHFFFFFFFFATLYSYKFRQRGLLTIRSALLCTRGGWKCELRPFELVVIMVSDTRKPQTKQTAKTFVLLSQRWLLVASARLHLLFCGGGIRTGHPFSLLWRSD